MCLLPRRFLLILGLMFLMVGTSNITYAQKYDGPVGNTEIPQTYEGFQNNVSPPQGPSTNDAAPCEFQDPDGLLCPIDSYLYVLLVLGVAYGYFKFGRKKVAVL